MTDKELEQIYNEAYRAVYWTAMALLKNEADADDVVQDAFVSFMETYDDMKDTAKATALLKKIAANKCLDRIKLTRTVAVEDEFFEDAETLPEDFLPDSIIEHEESRKIIMNIIENSLSDEIRRTLVLYYFDELTTKEIAEMLQIPQGTVLWRLNFAKKKIKKEVEKYEKDKNTKLFGMALPFLNRLFIKEAEQLPLRPMPASIANLSASVKTTAAKAGSKITAEAVRKGTGIMINKALIATIASVIVVGGVAAGILIAVNRNQKPDESIEDTEIIESEVSEQVEKGEEETVFSQSLIEESEEVNQREETNSMENDFDPYSVFDPNATVLTGKPVVYGYEYSIPCTVGELEARGLGLTGKTVQSQQANAYYDEDTYFAVHCWFEEDYIENLSEDDVIVAFTFGDPTCGFEYNGVTLGITVTEFLELMGTPAYVGTTDPSGSNYEYCYLDEEGNLYRFSFLNMTGDASEPTLVALFYGPLELWSLFPSCPYNAVYSN